MLSGSSNGPKHIKAKTQLPLDKFINQLSREVTLEEFCSLDDYDLLAAIRDGACTSKVLPSSAAASSRQRFAGCSSPEHRQCLLLAMKNGGCLRTVRIEF